MTPHRMTGTTTHTATTTPTPTTPHRRRPSPDLSGVSEVIVSGSSLYLLSPPSRSASDGWGKLAERRNTSRVEFLRKAADFGLALRSYRVNFQVPKRNFSRSLRTAENSDFDSGARPYGRIRILIRTPENPETEHPSMTITRPFPTGMLTLDDLLPWRSRAACCDTPPDLFYPEGTRPPEADIDLAKQICHRCPVKFECLTAADDFGIWGGLAAAERRRLDLL